MTIAHQTKPPTPSHSRTAAPGREIALRRFLGTVALLLGVIWLGLLVLVEWHFRAAALPSTMRASLCLAQAVGWLAILYCLLSARIAAPLGLGLVALVGSAMGLLGMGLILGFDPIGAAERAYVAAASPAWKPLELWQYDERYGYRARPNASGRHEHLDFNVTYTIDETGRRVTPTPKTSRGEILITGCSFTFGFGLNDEQPYAALLASDAWAEYKVVNAAALGWGTAHALLTIEDRLKTQPLPQLVLYAMIPQHVERNYLRESWLHNLLTHPAQRTNTGDPKFDRRGQPHFELEEGELKQHAVAGIEEAVPDAPELYAKELALTCAMLAKMQSICRHAEVPFLLVMLPTKQDARWPHDILATCGKNEISYLDLSGLRFEGFTHNQHPHAGDHRRIAAAIAASPLVTRVLKDTNESSKGTN